MDKDWYVNSTHISEFLSFLRAVQTEYNIAVEKERDADEETQDILHRLELKEDSWQDMTRIAAVLQAVRRQRREAKDAKMLLEPVIDWLHKNKGTINSLEQMLGEIRKVEKRITNRRYTEKTGIVEEILRNDMSDTEQKESTEESGVNCDGTEKEGIRSEQFAECKI